MCNELLQFESLPKRIFFKSSGHITAHNTCDSAAVGVNTLYVIDDFTRECYRIDIGLYHVRLTVIGSASIR